MHDLSCEEVLQGLEVYLDGEAGRQEAVRIQDHLGECPECFERRSFVTRLRGIVRRKCGSVDRLPPGLAERIRRVTLESGPDG